MSNYGYGQNPFDERNSPGGGGYGGYNQGGYNQGGYSDGGYGQQSYGGGNTYDQGGSMEMSGGGSMAFLNECRSIANEIKRIEDEDLVALKQLHLKASKEADLSPESKTNQDITKCLRKTSDLYTHLVGRLRTLASNPESQSPKCKPQFDRVKRSLHASMQEFTKVQATVGDKTEELKRQYKVAYGQEEYERKMREDGPTQDTQVFSQALMQSNRAGQANKSLQALRDRANALQAIEKQMEELTDLFVQMDTLVVQQDVAVAQIEQKAEETVEHLDKGNEEIGVAVETARKTRKKKWICLGIVVLIIIIIAGAVGGYLATQNRGNSNPKRSLLSDQLRGGPARLVDRERLVPRVVGESNIKKWVEKTQRRGVVPTGMSMDDGDLNGDAFDLVKRV